MNEIDELQTATQPGSEMNEFNHFMLSEDEQRVLDRYRELQALNLLGPNRRRTAKLEDLKRGAWEAG